MISVRMYFIKLFSANLPVWIFISGQKKAKYTKHLYKYHIVFTPKYRQKSFILNSNNYSIII